MADEIPDPYWFDPEAGRIAALCHERALLLTGDRWISCGVARWWGEIFLSLTDDCARKMLEHNNNGAQWDSGYLSLGSTRNFIDGLILESHLQQLEQNKG